MKKTKPQELNLDLLIAIGTIFTLLIVLSTWFTTHIELKTKLEVATSKAQQAEATIQELSTTNLSLHSSLISLNKSYDELEENFYTDVPRLCKIVGVYVQLRDNIKAKDINRK